MTDDLVDGRPSGRPPGFLPGGLPAAGPARESPAPGVRILHVDDDELNRALVRTALARSAAPLLRTARLIEAADLAHAPAVLAEGPVDVVLLDMRLPSAVLMAAPRAQCWRRGTICDNGHKPPDKRTLNQLSRERVTGLRVWPRTAAPAGRYLR